MTWATRLRVHLLVDESMVSILDGVRLFNTSVFSGDRVAAFLSQADWRDAQKVTNPILACQPPWPYVGQGNSTTELAQLVEDGRH